MQLKNIGHKIREFQNGGKVVVITDENVGRLYLKQCEEAIEEAGFETLSIVVKPGEVSKSQEVYFNILGRMARAPISRSDSIVALGGGVVGDLAGFVAATYLRGIKVFQVPTSLLAAVDSSVGGKTAINLPEGKNLVGAFWEPTFVLQDSSLLKTLPEEYFLDGMAEVIKYGVIKDKQLFQLLKAPNYTTRWIDDIIGRCVNIKKSIVAEDFRDEGKREILNFGHSLGHCVEILSDFTISHGRAVAIGMAEITRLCYREKICSLEVLEEVEEILNIYGFNTDLTFNKEDVFRVLERDKKRRGNKIDLIVPREIGRAEILTISIDDFRSIF